MKILRVFPRRTNATPTDEMALVGEPGLWRPDADEVHVSVTFTWDLPAGRRLAKSWARYYPVVKLGGPALDDAGGPFVRGRYMKPGNVITSRGCPNRCPRCFVPEREGGIRTLPIVAGSVVHDNNLLACPPDHINAVFGMLGREPQRPVFAGGLESRLVTLDIARCIAALKAWAFLAYDTPADKDSVEAAARLLLHTDKRPRSAHWLSCYVLVGYEGDTIPDAAARLEWVKSLDVTPLAMYYLPKDAKSRTAPPDWAPFVRAWARPSSVWAKKSQNPVDTPCPVRTL